LLSPALVLIFPMTVAMSSTTRRPPSLIYILSDYAAVDYFCAFFDDQISLDVSKDVAAAAVFDDEVAIDRAAHIEFSAVDDGDVPTDRAPELDGFVNDGAAGEPAAFFAHGGSCSKGGVEGKGQKAKGKAGKIYGLMGVCGRGRGCLIRSGHRA